MENFIRRMNDIIRRKLIEEKDFQGVLISSVNVLLTWTVIRERVRRRKIG